MLPPRRCFPILELETLGRGLQGCLTPPLSASPLGSPTICSSGGFGTSPWPSPGKLSLRVSPEARCLLFAKFPVPLFFLHTCALGELLQVSCVCVQGGHDSRVTGDGPNILAFTTAYKFGQYRVPSTAIPDVDSMAWRNLSLDEGGVSNTQGNLNTRFWTIGQP